MFYKWIFCLLQMDFHQIFSIIITAKSCYGAVVLSIVARKMIKASQLASDNEKYISWIRFGHILYKE